MRTRARGALRPRIGRGGEGSMRIVTTGTSGGPRRRHSWSSFWMCGLLLSAIGAVSPAPAGAQESSIPAQRREPVLKQVAPDLHFLFDYSSSNASFLVTDEGVLVVDTRQHVRDGEDLIARIRKLTDKPIKWVVNSHFHADHYLGNPAFKAAGATIVAHRDTAELMARMHAKEISRRGRFFASRGYDPKDVALVLPDVTFDQEMTIRLGGREIRLLYLGPGQQAGDTFVLFPHLRAMHTPGAFAHRSWANTVFTPSVEGWIGVLRKAATLDVDAVLPAHGDLAKRADIDALAGFLSEQYDAVKAAAAKGMSADQAVATLPFEQYKDWRNYDRRAHSIRSLHELVTTGKAAYFK
jgi:glyoxylase-like metal-dependent hydrolase (beta-lactamase superfamily II)